MNETEYTYLALTKVLGGQIRDNYVKDLINDRDYWKNKLQNYLLDLQAHNVSYECHNCKDLIIIDDYDTPHFTCDNCNNKFHECCKNDYNNSNMNQICGECKQQGCPHRMEHNVVVGGHYRCFSYIKRCPLHNNLSASDCPWKFYCSACLNCTMNLCNDCLHIIKQDI